MTSKSLIACAAMALTAACGGTSEMPSAEQQAEMNEAAEMLDKAPDSLSNVDDTALRSEQQPDGAANSAARR